MSMCIFGRLLYLSTLARTTFNVVFTVAPRTRLLMAMWRIGKLFPRSDRSPIMVPHDLKELRQVVGDMGHLTKVGRITSGFYISEALEMRR